MGEIAENNLGDVFDCSYTFKVCYGIFAVYIIPQWPIKLKSPDLFKYFLDDFGNFENFVKIWIRGPPIHYQNATKNKRKLMESSWNILYL